MAKRSVPLIPRDQHGELPEYAWPGGYPLFYFTQSNETVCAKCANSEVQDEYDPVCGGDVLWEGAPISCDSCGAEIESAYGDADAESEAV